ncbi:MAG TPA: hypothetical protein VIL04_04825 [Solirubrobacterales bacterium]
MKRAFALGAVALALAAIPAEASAEKYTGKTTGGTKITFKRDGAKVKNLKTMIFVTCVSLQTPTPRSGIDFYQPPKSVRIGRESKQKKLQPSAVAGWDVTKNYAVKLSRKGKKVKGKLDLNYSFVQPDLYNPKIYICQGTTRFTAKPK